MRIILLAFFACLFASSVSYAEGFIVDEVRIEGLQRIPVSRVLSSFPVEAGNEVDESLLAKATRVLFKSGIFDDVQLLRDGNVLIVKVQERPMITQLDIKGNKKIPTDGLEKGLEDAGLSEGQVFKRATLESIRAELQRQYIAQGHYGAKIDLNVTPLTRNRVSIEIDIREGKVASIAGISIVGNQVYSDEQLRDLMELNTRGSWSFFKSDHKYSREKLRGDLETLRSWYLDRGYINFSVDSTQVSVTTDKKSVYLTVNVNEGDLYTVSSAELAGKLPVDAATLEPLILVQEGQTFSQKLMTVSSDFLTRRLANDGYTFADVRGIPEVDEETNTVKLTFFVDPGERVYVRRINFTGNSKTADEVLRREMRQFEGALASNARIDLSRERLQRLGFFSVVEAEKARVPGSSDLVDLTVNVEEQPSGSIGANVGYSQSGGFLFGGNISQNNFMGTGNRVSFALNKSSSRDSINFSYFNPYYTDDGISRGWNVFYTSTDFSKINVTSYAIDRLGGNVTFGYPLSEISRLSFSVGIENSSVVAGQFVAYDIDEFLNDNGTEFNSLSVTGSWRRSTLNRGVLASRGSSHSVALEVALPGSDVTFYKLSYDAQTYVPLSDTWTLRLRGEAAYGGGYGQASELPFYENYFSGGFGSVRGYRARSLGPRSPGANFVQSGQVDPDPDPIGGNFLLESGAEMIFPTPFAPDSRNIRTAFFIDAGNVFNTKKTGFEVELDQFRMSYGIGLAWFTVIGPLTFSYAFPYNNEVGDDTERFQFSLGQAF